MLRGGKEGAAVCTVWEKSFQLRKASAGRWVGGSLVQSRNREEARTLDRGLEGRGPGDEARKVIGSMAVVPSLLASSVEGMALTVMGSQPAEQVWV